MEELISAMAEDYRKLHEKLDTIMECLNRINSPLTKLHDEYVEIEQACRMLTVSRRTIYALMEEGTISFVKYNRKRKIRFSDIQAFLEKNTKEKQETIL
jgi:excisionase family DNA binding protein